MRPIVFLFTCTLGIALASPSSGAEPTDWPGFRGARATGVASGFATATKWDATDPNDKSILWKAPVPGLGHSCPTVVGNRIFVATAVALDKPATLVTGKNGGTKAADDNGEQEWLVLCYDKQSGKELWRQTAHRGTPKATRHAKASHANTTVTVAGDNVVAFFGSEGLYCYDLDGKQKWKRDLGVVNISKYGIGWGYASSPAVFDDRIVLVCDDPKNAYVIALDLKDGSEVWRRSREKDCERSWGTPLIHDLGDKPQVVVNGWPWIVAYDLATGEEHWRIEGGGDNPIPSPFIANDTIYVTNSHGGKSPIIALKPTASGNLSDLEDPESAGLLWRSERGGSYMSTPVVAGDYIYLGNTNGVLRCFHARTGEQIYEKRLASGAYLVASLVAANDKIYCTAEDGTVYVVKAGPDFEILSTNQLGKSCLATPAISAGVIYFRIADSLLAIGPNSTAPKPETTGANKAKTKPNVLFIAVDDLRTSIGSYGDTIAVTPNFDRLAAQSIQFNRAYCQVAVCNPSRASLMTGLKPDTLGVWTLPIHFREAKPDAVTLPQWLRNFGYTAVSHGKIYHNPTPDPQSWSEPIRSSPRLPYPYPDGTRELVKAAQARLPKNDWRKNNLRNPSTASPDLPDDQLLDGARTEMCLQDIERLGKKSQPFFLGMGFIRPHLAFVAPKKYWDLYDPAKLPVLKDQQTPDGAPQYSMHNNSELSHYVDLIDMPSPWDKRVVSESDARRLMHGYYACVSYVDAQIGRLLDKLEEEGLDQNTIIVMWSDHGWKLGEHRGWGKMTNYEIDARVPMMISVPQMDNGGQATESLVELLDLYPTLCDLCGVEKPDFAEGKSLLPILKDTSAKVRESAVSQYYRRHQQKELMGYSLRTDRYRYVEWRDFSSGSVEAQELYDHQVDGSESKNLMNDTAPEVIKDLASRLSVSHPAKKLMMTPAIHSSPTAGRFPAKLSFQNQRDTSIIVYPITPVGRRGRGAEVKPGKQVSINARIGGVFVVESRDGKTHEIHSPSWPFKPVVIQ